MATGAIVPPCYDNTGAIQDCNGTMWCQDSVGNQGPCQANIQQAAVAAQGTLAVSTPTSAPGGNPVANSAANSSGSTAISGNSLLNFFSAVTPAAIAAGTGTTTTTGLVQQVNPATGQLSYYNPATGQYVGLVPSSTGLSSIFGGSNSFFLIIAALVIAFFAFGGKKAVAQAT